MAVVFSGEEENGARYLWGASITVAAGVMAECRHERIETDRSTAVSCCVECGYVADETLLLHSLATSSQATVDAVMEPRVEDGRLHALEMFGRQLLERFNLAASLLPRLMSIVQTVHAEGAINLGRKGRLAVGAALALLSRSLSLPIAMVEIAAVCDEHEGVCGFGRAYVQVAEIVKRTSRLDVKLAEPVHFLERFWVAIGEEVAFLDRGMVLRRAEQVAEMARETWISEGRRCAPIAMACLLFTLRSLDCACPRDRVQIWCSRAELSVRTVQLRYREVQDAVLRRMRETLPWGADVSVLTVPMYLADLLRYQDLMPAGRGCVPMAFLRGEEEVQRRKQQILVAQRRIRERVGEEPEEGIGERVRGKRLQRDSGEEVDTEVLMIEKLLLRGCKRQDIEGLRNMKQLEGLLDRI